MKDREFFKDEYGTKRYKGNKIVTYLLETHPHVDMNLIWKLTERGFFSREEIKEFYQLHSYSECGYLDIFEGSEDG